MVGLKPGRASARPKPYRLEQFDPSQAALVASWVCDAHEAYWLAPKTAPPVTAADVRAWNRPGHEQLQLVPARGRLPVAYGELNLLDQQRGLVLAGTSAGRPQRRRCGVERGSAAPSRACLFALRGGGRHARGFPDNAAARAVITGLACARMAGKCTTYRPTSGVRLLRMSIKRPAQLAVPSF